MHEFESMYTSVGECMYVNVQVCACMFKYTLEENNEGKRGK